MAIENALTKLSNELDTIKEKKIPIEPIVSYLLEEVSENEKFAEVVLNKDKNLKGCIDFIFKKAREIIKGSCGCLEDKVVYEIARDYFYAPVEESKKVDPKNIPTKSSKEKNNQITLESLCEENQDIKDNNIKEVSGKAFKVEDNISKAENQEVKKETIPANNISNVVHFEEKKAQKEIHNLNNKNNNFEGQVSIFDLM